MIDHAATGRELGTEFRPGADGHDPPAAFEHASVVNRLAYDGMDHASAMRLRLAGL